MADITLLQQDIILLKLRIAKLEADKQSLISDVAVLTAERDQADRAVDKLSESLANTEKVCRAMDWSQMALQSKYERALEKIEQLKNELKDAYGSEADEGDDTPSDTSIQEESE